MPIDSLPQRLVDAQVELVLAPLSPQMFAGLESPSSTCSSDSGLSLTSRPNTDPTLQMLGLPHRLIEAQMELTLEPPTPQMFAGDDSPSSGSSTEPCLSSRHSSPHLPPSPTVATVLRHHRSRSPVLRADTATVPPIGELVCPSPTSHAIVSNASPLYEATSPASPPSLSPPAAPPVGFETPPSPEYQRRFTGAGPTIRLRTKFCPTLHPTCPTQQADLDGHAAAAAPINVRIDSDQESECDLDFHDIEVEYLDLSCHGGGTSMPAGGQPTPAGQPERQPDPIDPFDDPFLDPEPFDHHTDEDVAFREPPEMSMPWGHHYTQGDDAGATHRVRPTSAQSICTEAAATTMPVLPT